MAYGTSSTKRIIWTEPSGQVAVLYPIEAIENCIKDVPDGLSYHIVEDDDIPKNTFFERAWKIVDGKREGIWTTYSEMGNLKLILHYKNGDLLFEEDYHENGNLKSRGYYNNWEPAGLWESFDQDGQLINYAEFKG